MSSFDDDDETPVELIATTGRRRSAQEADAELLGLAHAAADDELITARHVRGLLELPELAPEPFAAERARLRHQVAQLQRQVAALERERDELRDLLKNHLARTTR